MWAPNVPVGSRDGRVFGRDQLSYDCDLAYEAVAVVVVVVVVVVRVRLKIIRNASIKNVGKSESCMVYQLRTIFKRTRSSSSDNDLYCWFRLDC